MNQYIDLHTHRLNQKEFVIAVYNLLLHEKMNIPDSPFSAGLHPWYADRLSLDELACSLNQIVGNSHLVAYGEIGLDKVCKIPMQLQQDVFEFQLRIATNQKKPVILHCVKAWDELIEICNNYYTIKILHGFNGGIELTERLLKNGFCFSIGHGIMNPSAKIQASIQYIPLTSLFCETDDSEITIQAVYKVVCEKLQIEPEEFKNILTGNFTRLRSELKL